MTTNDRFEMWTIYDHPSDYPDWFVVRCSWVEGNLAESAYVMAANMATANTLEAARACIPPGLHCAVRRPDDDPVIVETWL